MESRAVCREVDILQAVDCQLPWKGFLPYGCGCVSGPERRTIF